jgi:hypothetical protein
MTSYFEYHEGKAAMGDVVEFKPPAQQPVFEHIDATTIVEKIELTDEMKAQFEALGYTFGEDDGN